jgi:hypothetical protein
MSKPVLLLLVLGLMLIGVAGYLTVKHTHQTDSNIEVVEGLLSAGGVELVEAEFNSPSVTFPVDSPVEFMEKVDETGASRVFKVEGKYFVVDANWVESWKYSPVSSHIEFVVFAFPFGVLLTFMAVFMLLFERSFD